RAMSKLGWRKVNGVMLSAAEADAREAMAKKVGETGGGKAMDATSDVEEKTEQTFSKRRSAHFYFEGQFTDGEIRALVRVAEASRAVFVEAFQVPQETDPAFLSGVFLRHEGDHAKFLEKCTTAGALERKAAMELPSWEEFDPPRVEVWLGARPFETLRDEVARAVTRYAFHDLTQMPSTPEWLSQGVSAWIGDRVLGSALSCFPRGAGQGLRDAQTTLRWRRLVRQWVEEGTVPSFHDVSHAAPGELTFEMTVKAWSVVDWLMTAKRARLYDFLARCRTGSSGKALRRALGAKDNAELDTMWSAWVAEQR
ncbi:MAG: hypothetical protein K8T20_01370, partial [Planctomycetes bacterium]|nr:hypothetical protein [Planctomycetota bacterium]